MEMVNDEDGCKGSNNTDVVVDPLIVEQSFVVSWKNSVCNVDLTNLDLDNMMNGFEGDLLNNKPFDFVFCRVNILS